MNAGFGPKMPMGKSFVLVFIVFGAGIAFGFTFAYHYILQTNYSLFHLYHRESKADAHLYKASEGTLGITLPAPSYFPHEDAHSGDDATALIFSQHARVLCWVMTSPSNHEKKAIHVKNTWGKRCNKLIFMSSQSDEKLGAVGLPNVQEGRDWLWAKTKEAFKYIWAHHRDEADWFMKADDDTYVIVENLRYMLKELDPRSPIYFGCHFKLENLDYMSGGSGYVLSKEALRRFVEQALTDETKCKQSHEGAEDLEIGRCLEAVGVQAGDSRDNFSRYRFLPFTPDDHLIPGRIENTSWYWKRIYHPQSQGMDCCSEMAISFHYISPDGMHVMEYLIYHLRLFDGLWHNQLRTEPKVEDSTNKISAPSNVLKLGKAPEGVNATSASASKNSSGTFSNSLLLKKLYLP